MTTVGSHPPVIFNNIHELAERIRREVTGVDDGPPTCLACGNEADAHVGKIADAADAHHGSVEEFVKGLEKKLESFRPDGEKIDPSVEAANAGTGAAEPNKEEIAALLEHVQFAIIHGCVRGNPAFCVDDGFPSSALAG